MSALRYRLNRSTQHRRCLIRGHLDGDRIADSAALHSGYVR